MSSTKILFPPPPPTTNSLTLQQRTQLIRSTKKLGRILGTTPHLLDLDDSNALAPMHIHLPFNETDESPHYRVSIDSMSSRSSLTSSDSSNASLERSASSCSSIQSTHSRSGSLRSLGSSRLSDAWPSRKPPMLRLALAPPLETIPASPLDNSPSTIRRTHYRSRSVHSYEELQFTLRPNPTPSPQPSPTAPSFTIPSIATERRRKMERLRRKLGENVPLDLVFPADPESDDDDDDNTTSPEPSSPVLSVTQEKVLPATLRSPRKPRIMHTRDSIASLSPHRARRTFTVPKASRPAPPPPVPSPVHRRLPEVAVQEKTPYQYPIASTEKYGVKAKLCAIVESPDEHGSGCSQEFGLRTSPGLMKLESEWYVSDDEAQAQVQLWSTRKGYSGWPEPSPRSYRKPVPVC